MEVNCDPIDVFKTTDDVIDHTVKDNLMQSIYTISNNLRMTVNTELFT